MVDMEMRAWARCNGRAPRTLRRPAAATARSTEHEPAAVEDAISGDAAGDARAVVLATLRSALFDAGAADLAVDLALERGTTLVVVNVVELPPGGGRGPDLGDPPDLAAALRAPAERARTAGAAVSELRVRSARPLATLVRIIAALRPAIVVFGAVPERRARPRRLSPRAHRRAARALEARTTCLLWCPESHGPAAPTAPPPVPAGGRRPLDGVGR
jgi:hypothetical protein